MSKDKEPDNSLGKTVLLLGGAGLLAASTINGTALVLAGSAGLGFLSWWAVNEFLLSPEEKKKIKKRKKKHDRIIRDGNVIRYIVAGACGLATFLNPFIGVPGTAILIILWNGWKKETLEFLQAQKEKLEKKIEEVMEDEVEDDGMGRCQTAY